MSNRCGDASRIAAVGTIALAALLFAGCAAGDSDVPIYAHGEGVPAGSAAVVRWTEALGPGGYEPGEEATSYTDPTAAFGPATSSTTDVVCLGRGGRITLDLGTAIDDGEGAELAIYENGFGDAGSVFAELAFVSVSSDGAEWARFPTATENAESVGAYGQIDPTLYSGFAGIHPAGTGTAFDLAELASTAEVAAGSVTLASIRYLRIEDIVGDGSVLADDGNSIYDPYPTEGSAGFDLDGVAILR